MSACQWEEERGDYRYDDGELSDIAQASAARRIRAIADQAAAETLRGLNLQHAIETVNRELPRDRDARLARQQPWTLSGWDTGAA